MSAAAPRLGLGVATPPMRALVAESSADLGVLLAIVVLAVVVDLRFARDLHLGYDEAWHVFASTVQPITQLVGELRMEAHPPLHYLLLRLVTPRGSEIWPRLASIVPGLATVVLTHLCALRLRIARPVALLAALAMAVAPAHVNIAVCVRAYSLATALTLLAYFPLLRILRDPVHAAPHDRWAFSVAAGFAMVTEYSALLAIAAALIVLAWAWALDRGPLAGRLRALGDWMPALCVPAGGAWLVMQYRRWADVPAYNHLRGFFPAAGEHPVHFAIVGAARTLDLLLCPVSIAAMPATALAILAGTAIATAFLVRRRGPHSPERDRARAAIVLVHGLLWIMLLGFAYAGLYPYGGRLRQQFVLFPFLVLSVALALDVAYRTLHSRLGRRALAGAVALTILVGSERGLAVPLEEFGGGPLWPREIAAARAMLAADDALFTRQFDQVGIFTNTQDWRWTLERHVDGDLDRFVVARGHERFTVVRDRTWTVPMPPTPELFAVFHRLLGGTDLRALVVLAIPQERFDRAAAELPATRTELVARAVAADLVVTDYVVLDKGIVFRVTNRGDVP